MHILFQNFGAGTAWVLSSVFIFLRYAMLAGIVFGIFYYWKKRHFASRKIQKKFPSSHRIWEEIRHSAFTAFVFGLIGLFMYGARQSGYTQIYTDIRTYGWGWFFASIPVLLIIHDTYFYWMHRFIHLPKIYRIVHRVHHQSTNPSPWASLAFHPLEAILEIAIVPIFALLVPFHPLALVTFAMISLAFNVLGHCGFELFPKWFVRHPFWKWWNTSTHHNMHHEKVRYNFGLYFNWWDRMMNTLSPDYETRFEEITEFKADKTALPQM